MSTKVSYQNFQGVNLVSLTGGSKYEQGVAYGEVLAPTLQGARNHLVKIFAEKYNITYSKLVRSSELFYERYPDEFKPYLVGMADGSGLELEGINILNGMTTFIPLIENGDLEGNIVHCTYLYIPNDKGKDNHSLMGRNYDFYSEIYGPLASNLTITIFNDEGKVPTATIAMPGEGYCPSCVNANGLFMELNAGSPSGGNYLVQNRQTMLATKLQVMQNSSDFNSMHNQMIAKESDYSLIINTADDNSVFSYEYSSNSSLGMKPFVPQQNDIFVSTNFYQNSSWGDDIPVPTDATTWMGITRKNNAQNLASKYQVLDVIDMKEIMSVDLQKGGFLWSPTIYQMIFQPDKLLLSVRTNPTMNKNWVDIDLHDWFFSSISQEKYEAEDKTLKCSDSNDLVFGGLFLVGGALAITIAGVVAQRLGCCNPMINGDLLYVDLLE